jgi:phosphate transport system substrate-binding protein
VGEGKSVNWPVGLGGKGNEGVAGILSNTPGSIGYVNQAFVKGKLRAAALQNRSGAFVKPGLRGGQDALANIKLNDMLAGEDANPAGRGSYPISTLTWILAYQRGNGAKAPTIQKAMEHLLGPAQSKADDLGYVPLKESMLMQSRSAVRKIGK